MTEQKRLFPVSSWTERESSWTPDRGIGSRNGFTLMELLVYMLIVGVIVLIAGQAFSDSTKFRVRTQNMLRATQEAENVATIFKADLSQMGAKSSKESGAAAGGNEYGDKFSDVFDSVYMDPYNSSASMADFSSFLISASSGQSDLTFRRVRYDINGFSKGVEEIRWFVDEGILKRSCRTVDGVADDEGICPKGKTKDEAAAAAVEIATNVTRFQIDAPTPMVTQEEQIFPNPGNDFRLIPRIGDEHFFNFSSVDGSGTEKGASDQITLSKFYSNYDNANNKLKDDHVNVNQVIAVNAQDPDVGDWEWQEFCQNRGLLSFEKDNTYEISFELPFVKPNENIPDDFAVQPFVPGEDHMSVGFRGRQSGNIPTIKEGSNTVTAIEDFLFFPPYSPQGSRKRYMRFTVPADIDTVCLAFTFASYSPNASQARLKIKDLKIKKIAGINYEFDKDNPYNAEAHKNDKRNIKALKLSLQIARGGKNGEHGETGEIDMVIPTPSNGPSD